MVDAIALALDGEAGARLLGVLDVALSPDTLLNLLRIETPVASEPLRVLGIDDWSWRRGHRYGTIVVDLERHRDPPVHPRVEGGVSTATFARDPDDLLAGVDTLRTMNRQQAHKVPEDAPSQWLFAATSCSTLAINCSDGIG